LIISFLTLTGPFADERDEGKVLKPIIAKVDDQSQPAFEVERADDGTVVVYVPGAPDSRSGNVVYLTPDRVEPLNITFAEVTKKLEAIWTRFGGVALREGSWKGLFHRWADRKMIGGSIRWGRLPLHVS